MKLVLLERKKMLPYALSLLIIFIFISLVYVFLFKQTKYLQIRMGATLYTESFESHSTETFEITSEDSNYEDYIRPSKDPILNTKKFILNIEDYDKKTPSKIHIPDKLLLNPEDTLLNYFSILRDAANFEEGKYAGCGTVGNSTLPYPIAYNFLSSAYQAQLNYKQYLKSFENILHISLIKLKEVPTEKPYKRYFVELETIEGTDRAIGVFGYYYGFIDMVKEQNQYRIEHMELYPENYLCAPFHGWDYMAEAVVEIKYGGWCSLVKEIYPTQQEGYVKKVYFKGTDGNDYYIEFFHITNDYDIEIAQYRKNKYGEWEYYKLDPDKCLEKNK